MKTLGLIGGMSWLSTIDYYRIINQLTNEQLGALNSAKIFLCSVNFEDFKVSMGNGDWGAIAEMLTGAAGKLEAAGAECIIICANTPHMVANYVQLGVDIPLIHIAEATAEKIANNHIKKIALLGTRITMEQNFFKAKLAQKQIITLVPNAEDRQFIHDAVFNELGKGIFAPDTKARFIEIINELVRQGAGGVIFGCTEFPYLINQEDCGIPIFDTTIIHAKAAVEFSLKK